MKVSARKRRNTQPVECCRKTSMKALPKRKGNAVATLQLLKREPASMKAPPKRKGNFATPLAPSESGAPQ